MPGPPPVVYLKGGPCGGTLHKLSAQELNNDTVVCKGADYTPDPKLTQHNGHDVWLYQKPVPPPSGKVKAPKSLDGWTALRKSINRGMPETLRYAQRVNRQTLRTLSRTRKVRV